ncbi:MAG TPA: hypothetical protein VHX86_04395 [Tepidisphaeraceae bacterium]|jgi:hypothetical protein|nr:hypothetical protein [Tepidisphaeraceae bacterium]
MEAFEHIVKVYLEAKGYVVTTGVKFPVKKRCNNGVCQVHGYEVDIVAAKRRSLILASVKSFLGSGGVSKQGFKGLADSKRRRHLQRYVMFNERRIRNGILKTASDRYGYSKDQIRFSLFCGKFRACDEALVRKHLEAMNVGAGSVQVIGPEQIVKGIIDLSNGRTYINDPVLVTLKLLQRTNYLRETATVR